MINSITIETNEPNIEQMTVWGFSTPETPLSCIVDRNDLSVEDKVTYDDAVAIFTPDAFTKVTNTVAELSISRITSTPITVETEDVDFDLLSEIDKDKLRALLALFVSLNEVVA